MEFVLVVLALALSGAWAGIRLALRARAEAVRLRAFNGSLEARVAARTRELRLSLDASDQRARALQGANQAKTEFLAGMSHELRTPLNAVIGFAELLRLNAPVEPLTRAQAQAADQILAAGRHLLTLIEEVLDLARIESGRLSMSIEAVDPQLVARQVCDSLRPEAEAAGVTLTAPAISAGPCVVADRTRLRQVLLNLVSNAIKYNRPGGGVWVEVTRGNEGAVLIVRDTGVGIPQARMAELFQPFNRLGRETSTVAGTGIGLTVSRKLAEAMNGRLDVVSREGEGSIFTLTLPPARSSRAPVASVEAPMVLPAICAPSMSGQQATLLYVEDNPSNVALMRHVVAALGGIQLHVAETGHEGLALARDLRPDVIVLDINLPGLNGFELKARLDIDPLTRSLPVLALSASAMPQDIQRGREAGFREYLTKPIDIPAFARALNAALGADAGAGEGAGAGAERGETADMGSAQAA